MSGDVRSDPSPLTAKAPAASAAAPSPTPPAVTAPPPVASPSSPTPEEASDCALPTPTQPDGPHTHEDEDDGGKDCLGFEVSRFVCDAVLVTVPRVLRGRCFILYSHGK